MGSYPGKFVRGYSSPAVYFLKMFRDKTFASKRERTLLVP